MNNEQRAMCFAEWRKCWGAIQETPAAASIPDEKSARMAITRKAIGRERSWGDAWQQKDIDRLLAIMWSISASDNLDLQLRQLDQPLARAEASIYAQALLEAVGIEAPGREAYLNGICRRIHKKPLCDINDSEWRDVLTALNHTRLHKQGVGHSHRKAAGNTRNTTTPSESRNTTRAATSNAPF